MSSQDACPEAPVLRRQGFKLRGHEFTTDGGPRVEGPIVSNLFFPERLRLQNEQRRARDEAARLFSKRFFQAQLRWYGIPFDSTASRRELKELLKDAVLRNKCNEVPDSIVELEKSMRKYYEPALEAWAEKFDAWEAERDRVIEAEAWENHTSPGEKATTDLDRFMEHYFLTEDGEPDKTKTTEPLPLYGFSARTKLRRLAAGIRGLQTATGGVGINRTICIGWSRSQVKLLARRVHKEAKRTLSQHKTTAFMCAMAQHRDFQKVRSKIGPMVNTRSLESADLQKCRGSYLIRCDEVSRRHPSCELYTLDIGRGPLPTMGLGALRLSRFEGAMLLSFSDSSLADHTGQCSCEGEEDDVDEDNDSDEHIHCSSNNSPESKSKESLSRLEDSSRKRKRHSEDLDPYRIVKRARVELSKRAGLRVFIRLQGQDSEGNIYTTSGQGYLDFTDVLFSRFEGRIDLPYIGGRKVQFKGYKVAPMAKRSIGPWKEFFSSLNGL